MRTSKEELIQRGILLPGDTAVAATSPLPASSSRPASPRLNLPQLVNNNKSGRRPGDGGQWSPLSSRLPLQPRALIVVCADTCPITDVAAHILTLFLTSQSKTSAECDRRFLLFH